MTNCLTRVAKIFGDFMGHLKITFIFEYKLLWTSFGNIWATFIPTSGRTDYRQFFCRKKNEDI